MRRINWNDGWRVTTRGDFLDNFHGAGPVQTEVTLPHDAQIETHRSQNCRNGPDTGWFDGGNYIYTKQFVPPNDWNGLPLLLELEGAAQNAMVFVNQQFAGKCPYAYSGFRVNIGKFLQFGSSNEIKVVTKTGMGQTSRWYTGSGLYRPVWLLIGGIHQIEPAGVRLTTREADDDLAVVEAAVTLSRTRPGRGELTLSLEMRNSEGQICACDQIPLTLFDQKPETVLSRMDLHKPEFWSPETPNLYQVQIQLMEQGKLLEEQQLSFGVRTLSVSRSRGMRLNGKSIKLRGACLHQDSGVLGAACFKDAELRRIRRMKQAGFNAVRSAHNPASTALLEACDQVGMLVMDELFDVWNESKRDHDYSLNFSEWWEYDMASMVEKDYNHPCVILYAVGNEIPETGTQGGAALNRQMSNTLRKMDPTRPVVNCINGIFSVMPRIREILGEHAHVPDDINAMMTVLNQHIGEVMCHPVVTEATEETFAGVDVCGYNYMASRYRPDGERYPNRIILGSETAPNQIGYNWPLIQKLDYVLGDFCWAGWEYIGEAGVGKNDYELTHAMYGPWPWYLAYCGDFDLCGNRRPQSYYREIVFGLRQTPYLCVERPEHFGQEKCITNWTWSDVVESWSWSGWENKPVRIEVYTAGDEVEFFLNGQSLGRTEVGTEMPFCARFQTIYRPGILKVIAYQEGAKLGEMSLMTAEPAIQVELTPERDSAPADPSTLIYLDLTLSDAKGRWNPSALAEITLSIEGPAVLAGFGSADPTSLEEFNKLTHTTFDGRAMAVLRAIGTPGSVTVTATAQGLQGTRTEIRLSEA